MLTKSGGLLAASSSTTPLLQLVKVVSGGAAVPKAWTLNAGSNTDSFSGPGPIVGPSPIAAGVGYTLFETGGPTSGYTPGGWVCIDPSGAPVARAGQQITLQAGQNVTCTITNTSTATAPAPTPTTVPTPTPLPAPTLQLVKVVSGGAAVPSAWTLNAGSNSDSFSGPRPIVGPSPIAAGVGYTLFETGGPTSGYTPGGWVCIDPSGAPVARAGQQITLQAGHNATCTITNTNIATAALAPTSTSTPTPAPTLTPKPTPTPTPSATPPAPAGIAVPSSIDATGASDASAVLMSFLNTVPDGSTIVFKAGGVYRMNSALKFAGRHNLVFEGNGATLKSNGGTTEASSLFWIGSYGGGNSGITIRDFTLLGKSTTPGVYQGGKEGAHGILVDGSSNIEIANVTVSGVWGDCFYVGSWADGVWIHDSTCLSSGRSGVTITAGKNVTVERVAFPKSGYCTFNVEPNVSSEGGTNIVFKNNTAGTFGMGRCSCSPTSTA